MEGLEIQKVFKAIFDLNNLISNAFCFFVFFFFLNIDNSCTFLLIYEFFTE